MKQRKGSEMTNGSIDTAIAPTREEVDAPSLLGERFREPLDPFLVH